jgi:proline dehydrogenase
VAGLWQRAMIGLARSGRARGFAERQAWLAGLAGRFTGGPDAGAAITAARALRAEGISASLFFLGEYIEDPAVVDATTGQLAGAAGALAAAGLDVSLSADPTQLGLMHSEAACEANLRRVAAAITAACQPQTRPGRDALMLDMEDSGTTAVTLGLHDRLRGAGLPAAVTVQAYLHRSPGDLDRLARAGAWVRLVKGAFAEPAALAATRRAEITRRYLRGVLTLLSQEARQAGCYPSFATHDQRLITAITTAASDRGWSPDQYEFEMLHGVRPDLQRDLARQGHRIRAYLPFGADWFPYAIRRIGESPRNARFALTAITRPSGRSPVPR